MIIFNPIEAGVSPVWKLIKIFYRADFCCLLCCKSPLDSAFNTLLTSCFVTLSKAALSLYYLPLCLNLG